MNIFSLLRRLSSFQIIVLSFALLIGSGTLLLMTPWATQDGQGAALLPACFTAVSASCVTGLTVVDTASYWSHFGQLVILMLIQVGGLGVVTMAVAITVGMGQHVGLMQRSTMQDAISAQQIGGIGTEASGLVVQTLFFLYKYSINHGAILPPVFG